MITRKNPYLFYLVTAFSTPWSRQKNNTFHLSTTFARYGVVTWNRNFIFIVPLQSCNATIMKKNFVSLLKLHYAQFAMSKTKNTISHLINTLTTLWSYHTTSFYNYLLRSLRPTKLFKKVQKLSSLFLGNFAGVLHYLLPILSARFFCKWNITTIILSYIIMKEAWWYVKLSFCWQVSWEEKEKVLRHF